jgi:hypothetical protein
MFRKAAIGQSRNLADTFVNANIYYLSEAKVRSLTAISLGLILTLHANTICAQTTPGPATSPFAFDQKEIALHFLLFANGGAIDLVAKDSSKSSGHEVLRKSAHQISENLAAGNFDRPLFPEAAPPPNLPALRKQKAAFVYQTEEITNGLRIRITTSDPGARETLHDFLRFEIAANKTGDAVAEPNSPKHDHPGIKDLGRDAPPGPPD